MRLESFWGEQKGSQMMTKSEVSGCGHEEGETIGPDLCKLRVHGT